MFDNEAPAPIQQDSSALSSGRRGLLRNAGIGAAVAGAMAAGFAPGSAKAAETINDADILNFALNLEYLEAEFYLNAVHGHGLPEQDTTGVGNRGKVTGGAKVPFIDKHVRAYAHEIANDELNHVLFLRSALGAAAVARPAIDIGMSFTTLARAAGLVGPKGFFDPYQDDVSFLIGAYIFEDVGVTAYLGAAASITTPAYLTAAASILAVEAYHASEVRLQLLQRNKGEVTTKISALRAALANANDDQGVKLDGKPNIVPTDSNSLAFPRTTSQVLNIVYGGGSASGYLFYPNMMNGTIK